MRLFHHYHHHRLYSALHSDFWNFEFSVWLHTLGRSLISIFIPILMLNFGYSLSWVIFYYLLFNLIDVPCNFVARRFILIFGARAAIIVATLATILYFLLFPRLALGGVTILVVLAILDAIYDTFYWVAHMYLFFESTRKPRDATKNTSILNSTRTFAGMLGPGIGALLIVLGERTALIGATVALLFVSLIPLLRLKHVANRPVRNPMPFREFFREWRERRDYVDMFFSALQWTIENIIWPLFIFTLLGTLNSIALIAVIVSVGQIIFSYFTGTLTRHNRELLILIGCAATIVIWILRLTYHNELFFYASVLLSGFFAIMISVPIEGSVTERAHQKDSLWAATYRNTSTMLPQFLLFGVLASLVEVFGVSFSLAIASLILLILVHRLFSALMKKTHVSHSESPKKIS